MNEFVRVFEWFVLVVDGAILVTMAWCVIHNLSCLITHDYNIIKKDVPFRVMMLGLSSCYVLANLIALKRHMDFFLVENTLNLSQGNVEELLSDRTFMLATAFFIFKVTKKYKPEWYEED